jgi:hypothetical protein
VRDSISLASCARSARSSAYRTYGTRMSAEPDGDAHANVLLLIGICAKPVTKAATELMQSAAQDASVMVQERQRCAQMDVGSMPRTELVF